MTMRPCLTCGRPTRGRRCAEHGPAPRSIRAGAGYRLDRAAALAGATHCHWCGVTFTPDNPPTADHVVPLIHDQHSRALVPACRSCNSRRGSTTRGEEGQMPNKSLPHPPLRNLYSADPHDYPAGSSRESFDFSGLAWPGFFAGSGVAS